MFAYIDFIYHISKGAVQKFSWNRVFRCEQQYGNRFVNRL